jgi:toxin ParE1/3/4
VNLVIQEAAEQDILHQVAWYTEQGDPDVARRFGVAAGASIAAVIAMPESGAPRPTANPRLAGLRTWPVKGFDQFRIYYLVQPGQLIIVRILHDRRDTETLLEVQDVQEPGPHERR